MSEQINVDPVMPEAALSAQPVPVGEQLASARKALGIEVSDVAQRLKLGERQVDALERGDWHSLPGNTFIRGFVRNYARLINIDPAPLMLQLDGILEKPVEKQIQSEFRQTEMPQAGGASKRDRLVVIVAGVLVLLAALVYFLLPNDLSALRESTQSLIDSFGRQEESLPAPAADQPATPAEPAFPPGATPQQIMNPQSVSPVEPGAAAPAPAEPVSQAPASTATNMAAVAAPAASTPTAAPSAPQMRFIFEKESWLEVRDRDNKPIFSQRVSSGTEQTLSGQGPLSLTVGYAPGVRVFWRGQSVDLAPHTRGDVARLVLE
jgi:cytoskeleton protein RodZ